MPVGQSLVRWTL